MSWSPEWTGGHPRQGVIREPFEKVGREGPEATTEIVVPETLRRDSKLGPFKGSRCENMTKGKGG